jgi:hypothetical protein
MCLVRGLSLSFKYPAHSRSVLEMNFMISARRQHSVVFSDRDDFDDQRSSCQQKHSDWHAAFAKCRPSRHVTDAHIRLPRLLHICLLHACNLHAHLLHTPASRIAFCTQART